MNKTLNNKSNLSSSGDNNSTIVNLDNTSGKGDSIDTASAQIILKNNSKIIKNQFQNVSKMNIWSYMVVYGHI